MMEAPKATILCGTELRTGFKELGFNAIDLIHTAAMLDFLH